VLEKYGKTLFETQFSYQSSIGENCVTVAVYNGNFDFMQYFLSVAHNAAFKKQLFTLLGEDGDSKIKHQI
jgi:hypothetical protein